MDARQKVMANIDLIEEHIDEILEFINKSYPVSDEDGEQFYNLYHDLTGKAKTDKQRVFKEWKKMRKRDRKTAMDHVFVWAEYHKLRGTEIEYIKKCYTYLRDKNYEDELDLSKLKRMKAEIEDFNEGAKIFR